MKPKAAATRIPSGLPRHAASALLWMALGVLPVARAQCDPPPNETCAGAVPFTTADLPYSVMAPLGCVNDIPDKPYFDVFYRYDCMTTGTHVLDMCGSPGDMYLRVYVNGCGFLAGDELAVADDECAGSPPSADPRLTLTLEAGTTYWIELGPWRPDPPWAPPPNSIFSFNVTLLAPPPCPGDANGDLVVDFADLNIVLSQYGQTGAGLEGDLNADGAVGFEDLNIVLGVYGESC